MRIVSGVDHIGLGVKNLELMKSFYGNVLGFNNVLGEMPEEDHPPILAGAQGLTQVHGRY
jgi:catechol 2,3-dioxygenase-like lactoylglutathione lyase family enzyme